MSDQIPEIIRNRRAIYPATYTNELIDDSVIWDLLEAANWAPTHRKTEPWRFRVFSGDSKQRLANHLAQYYKDHTPAEKFSQNKYDKTLNKPNQASHVIAIIVAYSGEDIIPAWEEEAAVACAVQNLWLTCSSKGLGGYWSTPKSAVGHHEIFELKENEKCLGLFYLGVPKPIARTIPGERAPIQDKVKWMQ